MNKQIVRLLLKYTETLSHEGRLIQIIPNGYIEDIADEIEALVNKNSVIHDVIDCDPVIHNAAIAWGHKCGKCGSSKEIK